MNLKIGDSVKVKFGVKEPDTEDFELGGWQGNIKEINFNVNNDNLSLITIEWDSLALENLPAKFIQDSEIEGLDWKSMILYKSDLDLSISKDSKAQIRETQKFLSKKNYWYSFGDIGHRIMKVLDGTNPNNEMEILEKWFKLLDNKLSFSIKSIVEYSENESTFKENDIVIIDSLPHFTEIYGVIIRTKKKDKNMNSLYVI